MSIILAPILGTENYLTEKTFCFMKKRGVAFFLEEDLNVIYIFFMVARFESLVVMWGNAPLSWCKIWTAIVMVDQLEVNCGSYLRNKISTVYGTSYVVQKWPEHEK